MKKFLAIMFLIMICAASVTYAANYPKYLNWDNNCQLIWTYSRNGLYLKRDSIIVEQLDKNNYVITADIVNVSYPVDKDNYTDEQITFADNANEHRIIPFRFKYDVKKIKMYVEDTVNNNKEKNKIKWKYLDPNKADSYSGYKTRIGEILFYITQGHKFYGGHTWKTQTEVFTDSFYSDFE
ncbi:MAG: hypothetical protein IJ563_05935 [Selenomonadaceae bacterium]|nr:hypothetical protein [Selenomonadaceae bacterium]MBR1859555.1 hypothetical protein [Selenomonadaceae bacterium]